MADHLAGLSRPHFFLTSMLCAQYSRGLMPFFWMNPMRPVFVGITGPLPRPNHPVRALFPKVSRTLLCWRVSGRRTGQPLRLETLRGTLAGGCQYQILGERAGQDIQYWINPMRPSHVGNVAHKAWCHPSAGWGPYPQRLRLWRRGLWIPAFAGMTVRMWRADDPR